MRLLKGTKIEGNENRGRSGKNFKERNPQNDKIQKEKETQPGRVKTFFPVCLLWVTACSIYGQAVIHGFPLPAQRNSEKEKLSEKP